MRPRLVSAQPRAAASAIDHTTGVELSDGDRALVRAFMRGLNETAAFDVDRAGLRTEATRDGDCLSIQSALTTEDAHVRVRIGCDGATVVYLDPQHPRSRFFRDLMRPYDIEWQSSRVEGVEESVGRYVPPGGDELQEFMRCLGSRIVYLIDWNRARRRLSRLVKNADAVALLKWAADNNIGHRAFLRAGDTRLVHAALERAAPAHMRTGGRLDDLLGSDAARLFLMAVLRIAASARTSGRSAGFVNEEIETELLMYLQRPDRTMLGAAADHATVIAAAVEWISHALRRLKSRETRPDSAAAVALIRTWRAHADEFARRARRLLDRSHEAWEIRQLMGEGDQAVKALGRTAFTLTLVPPGTDSSLLELLDSFCGLVNHGVREYIRLLDEALDLSRAPDRSDLEQLLVTVDRLVALDEHCDAAGRTVLERLIHGTSDFRELYLLSSIAHHLDSTFDALVRSSLIVRDHVLASAPASWGHDMWSTGLPPSVSRARKVQHARGKRPE